MYIDPFRCGSTQFLDTTFHSITCFCLFVWQLIYLFTIDDLLINSIFCQVSSSCLYWSVCIHLSGWKGQLIYLKSYIDWKYLFPLIIWLNLQCWDELVPDFLFSQSWLNFVIVYVHKNLRSDLYYNYLFFNCYWYLIALHGVSIVKSIRQLKIVSIYPSIYEHHSLIIELGFNVKFILGKQERYKIQRDSPNYFRMVNSN